MAGDTVQQIKDKLSIVDTVSQYVKLERAGSNMRARCPFHAEKTPSFFVSPERGTFHCFGCDKGGDIFTFVQEIEGLDFKGALKVLAEKAGVPLDYTRGKAQDKDANDRLFEVMEAATIFYTSRFSDEASAYLNGRGATVTTVKEFRLGLSGNAWSDLSDYLRTKKFSEKEILDAGLAKKNERGSLVDKFRNRIMFPIADSAGRIVAFSGRIFGADASPEAPKYLNSPETLLFHKSRILYGFDRAKVSMRKVQCAVLVEGQMDLLMSHQAGWANTVAASGTAFTDDHARLIKRMTDNLVLALDPDPAGIKAAARASRAALTHGLNVKVARLKSGLDPADFIKEEGPDAWRAAIRESKDIITFLLDVLEEHTKGQADRFRRSVELGVLPFVTDVQSPIARAQYVKEIATRLGVGAKAVEETLQKMPDVLSTTREVDAKVVPAAGLERKRHAYAILLWQESEEKSSIDVKSYRKDLEKAIGKEELQLLEALPEGEKEALRFSAERMHTASASLVRDTQEILRVLEGERVRKKLVEATRSLEQITEQGGQKVRERLEKDVRLYTEQLAQLHQKP
ncbi:MAG: DNA primase [bacterium]|nr:DNA primase [bacterium]